MRDLQVFLSHHTENSDKDINYEKFTLKKTRRHKPNHSFVCRGNLYEQRKKSIAFGYSTERYKEDIKLPPLASYDVSYQQIDANIQKVRITTERNNITSKLSTETSLNTANHPCKIARLRTTSMQKQAKNKLNQLELQMPQDYFPTRHFQPMSLEELNNMFENLLYDINLITRVKHRVKKPSCF